MFFFELINTFLDEDMFSYIYKIILFQIILSFIIIKASYRLDLTDKPKERKIHLKPVAYTGGLILSLTFLFIVFITNFHDSFLNLILSYSILITFAGFIDDKYNVNPGTKILLQIIPIYLLINQDLYLTDIGNYKFIGTITLGSFSKIFTLLCCILMINASNYCDGIDGLLSLLASIILISFGIYLILLNKTELSKYIFVVSIPLIIQSIFNFEIIKNLKVFLGDSGSNLIGFVISFITIYLYRYHNIHPSLLIWPLAFLVFEFLTVNLTRYIKGNAIFKAGNDHIHYELSNMFGLNRKLVLILILLLNLVFSMLGYLIFVNFSSLFTVTIYFISFVFYFLLRFKLTNKIKS